MLESGMVVLRRTPFRFASLRPLPTLRVGPLPLPVSGGGHASAITTTPSCKTQKKESDRMIQSDSYSLIDMHTGVRGRKEVDAPPAHLEQDEVEDEEGEGVVVVLHLRPEMYI